MLNVCDNIWSLLQTKRQTFLSIFYCSGNLRSEKFNNILKGTQFLATWGARIKLKSINCIANLKCFLQCLLYYLIIFSISITKTKSLVSPSSLLLISQKRYPLTPILLSLTLAYTQVHITHTHMNIPTLVGEREKN